MTIISNHRRGTRDDILMWKEYFRIIYLSNLLKVRYVLFMSVQKVFYYSHLKYTYLYLKSTSVYSKHKFLYSKYKYILSEPIRKNKYFFFTAEETIFQIQALLVKRWIFTHRKLKIQVPLFKICWYLFEM